ncbi:DUF3558 family protein [Herbihabitans rhizosphaerae]|uniref:DUF3558 family protein n=1 Tax=Herbihabitans rhizosphaerae TaxID=1872711 RepID=UPI0013EEA294|nr:DUF3558 family protein [Herbihabitans rhizosphaerae]
MSRSLLTAVFAATVLLTTACATTVIGTGRGPGEGDDKGTAQIPAYTPPPNGGGFTGQPMDQPLPIPAAGADLCAWTPTALPEMAAALGATGVQNSSSGCQYVLPNNKIVQIHATSPYNELSQRTFLLESFETGGLRGRVYAFVGPPNTICSVNLDVRALAGFAVDTYDRDRQGGNQREHCETAKKAVTVLAKKFVPALGGTPFPGARQQPPALQGVTPCKAVTHSAAYYAGVSDKEGAEQATGFGGTCTYEDDNGTVTGVVVSGDPSTVPRQVPGGQVREGRFGSMPARFEQAADTCFVLATVGAGQALGVSYKDAEGAAGNTCLRAQVVLAVSVIKLMQGS